MPAVSLKLRFEGGKALGPGKVRLLELIDELGSIWAAGRAMKMSYGRAWKLSNELNGMFEQPLLLTHHGGSKRGGASLTALGHNVVKRYRSIEAEMLARSGHHFSAFDQIVKRKPDDALPDTRALP
ncbi:MAG: LysR family transcriptional regulator [Candidatus Eremiobacteraeota bacterium]|nr:LysR family transcriptional regulator [Candidatus Eremiobacteraeota bacterium]